MILYDINNDKIIKIINFDYNEERISSWKITEMKNFSFDVGEESCEYIKNWYLKALQQTNGTRYASEYKRDLYITDLKDKQIKLIGCFIKSVDYKDTFLTIELYCDHYIIGDSTTFPELKSLYRNTILSVLGI